MPFAGMNAEEAYSFFNAAERSGRVLNVRGEVDSYMVHALAYLEDRELAPPAHPGRLLEIMQTAVIASQRAADLYVVQTLAQLCAKKASRPVYQSRPAPKPEPVAPDPEPVEPPETKPAPKPPKPVKPTKPLI
jgi:hypothetical protein